MKQSILPANEGQKLLKAPPPTVSMTKAKKPTMDEKHPLIPRIRVRKQIAADILIISPRHLQRVRKRFKFTCVKIGRDTYYFLDEIVNAILEFDLPYNEKVFEKEKARFTKALIL